MIDTEEECGAYWCSKKTARASGNNSRSIDGIQICQSCYQRACTTAKRLGKTKEEVFPDLIVPPRKNLRHRVPSKCDRKSCETIVMHAPGTPRHHKRVRNTEGTMEFIICTRCYGAAWIIRNRTGLSIYDAFVVLSPSSTAHKVMDTLKPRRESISELHTYPCRGEGCEEILPAICVKTMPRVIGTGKNAVRVCEDCFNATVKESIRWGTSMLEAWQGQSLP